MKHYCTYFDSNYLVRALPMIRSLKAHSAGGIRLYVLCLDEEARRVLDLLKIEGVVPVPLAELERGDPALAAVKGRRSRVEYYFTLTPAWIRYVFEAYPEADSVTYLDADLYFYASPAGLFEEMGTNSILIVPHRFPERLKFMEKIGLYNVSFIVFRRDGNATPCLDWWREQCLADCRDQAEDGRFADQKYLDEWPGRFRGVHVLTHKGANLAPWNIENYRITRREGRVMVDEFPLVFYHFHGYRRLTKRLRDPGFEYYGRVCSGPAKQWIHRPYVTELVRTERELSARGGVSFGEGNVRYDSDEALKTASWAYRVRYFLEGRALASAWGRAWLCDSDGVRRLIRGYDRLAGRTLSAAGQG